MQVEVDRRTGLIEIVGLHSPTLTPERAAQLGRLLLAAVDEVEEVKLRRLGRTYLGTMLGHDGEMRVTLDSKIFSDVSADQIRPLLGKTVEVWVK